LTSTSNGRPLVPAELTNFLWPEETSETTFVATGADVGRASAGGGGASGSTGFFAAYLSSERLKIVYLF
jgi:hypothetical protein